MYDIRLYGIPFFSRLIQSNTRQSLATRLVWKAFTKVLIEEPLQRVVVTRYPVDYERLRCVAGRNIEV